MPRILTQKQYQQHPKPTFCFLCGGPLDGSEKENDEHCPPEKMFAPRDRINYPTKIRVHQVCNEKWSVLDDRYAAVWSARSGNIRNEARVNKIVRTSRVTPDGSKRIIYNVPFDKLWYRIIRFAHALFYNQSLPDGTPVSVFSPMLQLDPKNLRPKLRTDVAIARKFCQTLVHAQIHDLYDAIQSYNGKFKYVCTWEKSDDGRDVCLFAFDLGGADFFSPEITGHPHCFVGHYQWPTPLEAPRTPRPLIEIPNAFQDYPIKF